MMASMTDLSRSVSSPSILISTSLPKLEGEIADETRELFPDRADRLHPGAHHRVLELTGDSIETLRRVGELRVRRAGKVLNQLVSSQHQFADEIHQVVEHPDIDANVAVGRDRSRCQFEVLVVTCRTSGRN